MNRPDAKPSNSPLTDEQKRCLAFGAILAYHRSEKILAIAPPGKIEPYVRGLQAQWEIGNADEAKETLRALLALERSSEIDPLLSSPSAELLKIQKEIASELGVALEAVQQTRSAYAWDIGRAIPLAKWCFWCGLLTEPETWDLMRQAVAIASDRGTGWTDYTVSFLLGRTIQGFDLDDVSVECKQLLKGKGPMLRRIEDIDAYQRFPFR